MAGYDVVIIGAGPGGYNAAIRAGQLGMKVACVEKGPTLGGTCLNVGCIPSKSLLYASELFALAGEGFAGFGIEAEARVDLAKMMAQKQASVDGLTKGVEFLFRKNKVERVNGSARLAGAGKVEVAGADGSTILETGAVVLATGSAPAALRGVALDGERIVDSTGALCFSEIPRRLIVIGAGIIGLELGSVWRRLGSEVTVLEYLERVTPGADGEIARALQRSLAKQGLSFRLGVEVTGARVEGQAVRVALRPVGGGEEETLEADRVLVAVGRTPYSKGVGLAEGGIATDGRGFVETDGFATSVESVYAIGDVTHGPMLAHKAEDEAVAVIERLAGKSGEVNPEVIPSVIYTTPEVAWVGRTEEELKAAGVAYRAGRFPFSANARARVTHETEGFTKILADAATDRILGAHMIGPQVSEMVAEMCLAMEMGAASEDVARTSHPHPTRSEALRQAAMGVEGWTMQA